MGKINSPTLFQCRKDKREAASLDFLLDGWIDTVSHLNPHPCRKLIFLTGSCFFSLQPLLTLCSSYTFERRGNFPLYSWNFIVNFIEQGCCLVVAIYFRDDYNIVSSSLLWGTLSIYLNLFFLHKNRTIILDFSIVS